MCLYPRLIHNPKYKSTKKNGGVIPHLSDQRIKMVPIGCQDCMECRKQKSREWQARLLEDIKINKNGKFITLTFSNQSYAELYEEINPDIEGYDRDNAISILAVRRFLERHRKQYGKSIRHWLVTELGHRGTENIHIHGIIWTDKNLNEIEKLWGYGHMWKGQMKFGKLVNYVNEKTVGYIVKYMYKKDETHKTYKSRILCSPGIGDQYTNTKNSNKNKFNGQETQEAYRTRTGHQVALPVYWRNKIYTEEEREKLWIQKLDKNERWVSGNRIDVSRDLKLYFAVLKRYQEKNQRLGYGNGDKSWSQVQYEKERRNLINSKRLKAAFRSPSAGSIQKG